MIREEFKLSGFFLVRHKSALNLIWDINRLYKDLKYDFIKHNTINDIFNVFKFTRKPREDYMVVTKVTNDWTIAFDDQINTDGQNSMIYNLNRLFNYEAYCATYGTGVVTIYYRERNERVLYSFLDDTKWTFYQSGEPMEFENLSYYQKRNKKDRFNLQIFQEYLCKMGLGDLKHIYDLIFQSKEIYLGKKILIDISEE